jgi:hypothetical protein
MPRYKLRTLLILLGVGPPMVAVAGMMASGRYVHPVLLAAVGYMGLVVLVIAISSATEAQATTGFSAWLGSKTRLEGHCSFCARSYREAGPLAEGPNRVYICEQCVNACGQLIGAEKKRIGG